MHGIMTTTTTTAHAMLQKATLTLGHVSSDITILATLFGITFFYTAYRGREEGTANVFALLIAGSLLALFPYWNHVEQLEQFTLPLAYAKLALFLVLFFVTRHVAKKFISPGYGGLQLRTIMETSLISLAVVGLLVAYGYHYFLLKDLYEFGIPMLKFLSETNQGLFIITLYSVMSFLFVRRFQG